MRLINVHTGLFQEFPGSDVPQYAILSHTWGANVGEVSYEDFKVHSGRDKKGLYKIEMTCSQSANDGIDWAWVDTCCIDKSSSAELTESINSMFLWYQRAAKCYVYLSDLPSDPAAELAEPNLPNCRWFTRGWTLQELVAPKHIEFYDQEWNFRFTKSKNAAQLSQITGIDLGVLQHRIDLSELSVAQKMSWAAKRETTRVEDRAYCLMGIFDINMPMLYGEENKAFMRLQGEIIMSCSDLSILAWQKDTRDSQVDGFSAVLASSAWNFNNCGEISRLEDEPLLDFSMSNRGIKLRAKFNKCPSNTTGYRYVLPVCRLRGHILGIHVRNIGAGCFVRQQDPAGGLVDITGQSLLHTMVLDPFLLTQLPKQMEAPRGNADAGRRNPLASLRSHGLQIVSDDDITLFRRWPWYRWDEEDRVFFKPQDHDLGWAALKFDTVPPLHLTNGVHIKPVGCMFYAFHWANPTKSWKPRSTIVMVCGRQEDRMLQDMTDQAVSEGWDSHRVVIRLRMGDVPETHKMLAYSSPEFRLYVSYDVDLVEDDNVCANPFWRVKFKWEKVVDGEQEETFDSSWKKMYYLPK